MKTNKTTIWMMAGISAALSLAVIAAAVFQEPEQAEITIVTTQREDQTTQIRCITKPSKEEKDSYTIYQLPMTDEAGGCCYAIQMPSGRLVMIDSGYESDASYIQDFIVEHGGKVDSWFITHPHFDHVGGLLPIIRNQENSKITIERIYYAPFTEEFFTAEAKGKDLLVLNNAILFYEFEQLRAEQEAKGETAKTLYIPLQNAEELTIEDMKVTCMHSFEPDLYDVNGNSLVLRLDIYEASMLITGDSTDATLQSMSNHWGTDNPLWKVTFLQIPHHGYMAGISSDSLYRMTIPQTAFVDCSRSEYEGNAANIQEHLKWLEALQIPVVRRYQGINEIVIE